MLNAQLLFFRKKAFLPVVYCATTTSADVLNMADDAGIAPELREEGELLNGRLCEYANIHLHEISK